VRSKKESISLYTIATVYFALGEDDHGFEWLEKGYGKRSGWVCYLKIDPALDSVRSDPRFKALLKKMNLE